MLWCEAGICVLRVLPLWYGTRVGCVQKETATVSVLQEIHLADGIPTREQDVCTFRNGS